MTPESVLRRAPLVLDQRARERYFEDGFLTVPGYVGAAWLGRLRAVVAAKIDESRALTASDDQFDLAPDHSADKPNIRRLRKAVDQHPELWAFAQDPSVVDLDRRPARPRPALPQLEAELQVVGRRRRRALAPGHPGVAAHELRRADLRRLPRGHRPRAGPADRAARHARGPIFDQFDDDGRWTGALTARDTATLPADTAVELCGPAGTVVLLHCRVVHGSAANYSPRMRPLLLNVYSAADALPITPGAGADIEDGRAGARAGATARAHGAVPGAPAAALGSGGLSLDLRRADDGVYGVVRYGLSSVGGRWSVGRSG